MSPKIDYFYWSLIVGTFTIYSMFAVKVAKRRKKFDGETQRGLFAFLLLFLAWVGAVGVRIGDVGFAIFGSRTSYAFGIIYLLTACVAYYQFIIAKRKNATGHAA